MVVNCQGKMNSGIAKQIRAEFPQVFEEYESHVVIASFSATYELLGKVQLVKISSGKLIANAFTQDKYGYDNNKYCSYDAIDSVMKWFAKYSTGKLGMPKIGAGLGGGDWKIIEAIINSHFTDRDVYVYEL